MQKPLSKRGRRAHSAAIARPRVAVTSRGNIGGSYVTRSEIARAYASNYRSEEGLHRDFVAVMTAKHEGKI